MLKALTTQEEFTALSETEQGHYVKRDSDDLYLLDVGSVDGVELDNVTGLKNTVATLRSEKRG
ncbi:unnamed protein product, partial [marine sediment metagenome]